MIDLLARLLEKLLPALARKWLRHLHVEVSHLSYEDMRSRPGDAFIVATPWPRRYRVRMRVKNRTREVAFVERVTLTGPNPAGPKQPTSWEPLRLEPGEPKEVDVCFALDEIENPPQTGEFTIEVAPSIGRTTRLVVGFPFVQGQA